MRSMPSISLIFLSIARMRHVTTVVIELRSKESGIVASSVERVYDDVVGFHTALDADALGFVPPPFEAIRRSLARFSAVCSYAAERRAGP